MQVSDEWLEKAGDIYAWLHSRCYAAWSFKIIWIKYYSVALKELVYIYSISPRYELFSSEDFCHITVSEYEQLKHCFTISWHEIVSVFDQRINSLTPRYQDISLPVGCRVIQKAVKPMQWYTRPHVITWIGCMKYWHALTHRYMT